MHSAAFRTALDTEHWVSGLTSSAWCYSRHFNFTQALRRPKHIDKVTPHTLQQSNFFITKEISTWVHNSKWHSRLRSWDTSYWNNRMFKRTPAGKVTLPTLWRHEPFFQNIYIERGENIFAWRQSQIIIGSSKLKLPGTQAVTPAVILYPMQKLTIINFWILSTDHKHLLLFVSMGLLPFAFQSSADHLTDFRTADPRVYKTPSFLAKLSLY